MRTKLVVGALIVSGICALVCLIMSIVFAYDISLIYPDVYVNVATNNNTQFYMRCDQTTNKVVLANLLQSCGVEYFNVQPGCNLLSYYSYWYGTHSFGEMKCPTGYLDQFKNTIDLNLNLVALASSMMIIGCFIFCVPFLVVYICVTLQ